MKKLLAMLLVATMSFTALVGCGQTSEIVDTTDTTETNTEDNAETSDEVYTIGIVQLLEHQALDAATEGRGCALLGEALPWV